VKSNVIENINYRDNLFIFCKAGVIQVARTLFGLIYGTWETAYKCEATVRLPFKDSLVVEGNCTMETIQRQNTEVVYRGRLSRISDEVSVMEMERRA
jgi:hypothetical protein